MKKDLTMEYNGIGNGNINIRNVELINEILKNIFEYNNDFEIKPISINRYFIYKDKELYCESNFEYEYDNVYTLNLDMVSEDNNKFYSYFIEQYYNKLKIKLRHESYSSNNKKYEIHYNFISLNGEISDKENKIKIFIEKKNIDNELYKQILNIIDFNDSLEHIYNLINYLIVEYQGIKIDKISRINNGYYIDDLYITDSLEYKDNKLLTYKTTRTLNNGKKVIIEKDRNNSVNFKFLNSSLEDAFSNYFNVLNDINFVKTLEKKK